MRVNSASKTETQQTGQTFDNNKTEKVVHKNPTFDPENVEPPVSKKF